MPLLVVASCKREARPWPRIAEVTSPVHVAVRSADYPVPKVCDQPALTDRLPCYFKPAERAGFTFVEVGAAADAPLPATDTLEAGRAAILSRAGTTLVTPFASSRVRLEFDRSGRRLLVESGETGLMLFFEGQRLVTSQRLWSSADAAWLTPSGGFDWSRAPLAKVAPPDLQTMTLDEVTAYRARSPEHEQAFLDTLLWGLSNGTLVNRFDSFTTLLDEGEREEAIQALLSGAENGEHAAIEWFVSAPGRRTPEFEEALLALVRDNVYDDPALLDALLKMAPKGAAELSCRRLEQEWFMADEYVPPSDTIMVPVAVLAHQQAKCPWVTQWLERDLCDPDFFCPPDELQEEEDDVGGEALPRVEKALGALCTRQQRLEALARLRTSEDEFTRWDGTFGALLLLAQEPNGALAPPLSTRLARYGYEVRYASTEDDACRGLQIREWACRAPAWVLTSERDGCKLAIDDTKRTLTVTPDESAEAPARLPRNHLRIPY